MPTIIRQDGFKVVIYSNDHIPAHVHVLKGSGEIRINLGYVSRKEEETTIPPSLMTVTGTISNKEIAKALGVVQKNQARLLTRWSEIHDE